MEGLVRITDRRYAAVFLEDADFYVDLLLEAGARGVCSENVATTG